MSSTSFRSEHTLDEFRALIESRSGMHFDAFRERFFAARIKEFLNEKRLKSVNDLMRLVLSSTGEYNALLQRLLTQETSFFRYPAVFQALGKMVLPELCAIKCSQNQRTLRIWSAGCATGEEPYSVAITVLENLPFAEAWHIEILATDISRPALAHALRGIYPQHSLDGLGQEQIANHFTKRGDQFEVKPKLRSLVKFVQLNLAETVYVGRMDCVFCMNVLMYFSESRRQAVLQNLCKHLEPGGYLLLGHSESPAKAPVKLERVVFKDHLVYRKPPAERTGLKRQGLGSQD